jgi:hypothetical protein
MKGLRINRNKTWSKDFNKWVYKTKPNTVRNLVTAGLLKMEFNKWVYKTKRSTVNNRKNVKLENTVIWVMVQIA